MSKTKQRPDLGQTVRITGEAIKLKERDGFSRDYRQSVKTRWVKSELPKTQEGIYIGWRTICDCDFTRSGRGEDYGESINNHNHRVVWLVVINEHMNPLYVFPEDVQVECPYCGGQGWYDVIKYGNEHDTEDCIFCDEGFIAFEKYLAYTAVKSMIDNFDLGDIPF